MKSDQSPGTVNGIEYHGNTVFGVALLVSIPLAVELAFIDRSA